MSNETPEMGFLMHNRSMNALNRQYFNDAIVGKPQILSST